MISDVETRVCAGAVWMHRELALVGRIGVPVRRNHKEYATKLADANLFELGIASLSPHVDSFILLQRELFEALLLFRLRGILQELQQDLFDGSFQRPRRAVCMKRRRADRVCHGKEDVRKVLAQVRLEKRRQTTFTHGLCNCVTETIIDGKVVRVFANQVVLSDVGRH